MGAAGGAKNRNCRPSNVVVLATARIPPKWWRICRYTDLSRVVTVLKNFASSAFNPQREV
jgi:hypothetical protein